MSAGEGCRTPIVTYSHPVMEYLSFSFLVSSGNVCAVELKGCRGEVAEGWSRRHRVNLIRVSSGIDEVWVPSSRKDGLRM